MKAVMKHKMGMLATLVIVNLVLALAPLARADADESGAGEFNRCKWMLGEAGLCYQGCGDNFGGCGGETCDAGPAGCPQS
jgi:hypothetical protein